MNENKQHSKPFKLEELNKKEVFSIPNGYFDKLPTIIQSRAVENTKKRNVYSPIGVMRLALPALLIIFISGYVGYKYLYNPTQPDSRIEAMLTDVSTEEMVSYLEETGITSDELLEMISFEGESLDDFSTGIDEVSDEDLELLINEFDFENENSI